MRQKLAFFLKVNSRKNILKKVGESTFVCCSLPSEIRIKLFFAREKVLIKPNETIHELKKKKRVNLEQAHGGIQLGR